MRLKNSMKLAMVLGAAAVALGGCGNKAGTVLIAAPTFPIKDVPIPAGFTMSASKSTSTVVPATSFRTAYHVYKGSDDLLPVVSFYRTQMPTHGWTLVDQTQLKKEVSQRYSKGKESVTVTVKEGLIETEVIVKLGPSDAIGAGPATQPK